MMAPQQVVIEHARLAVAQLCQGCCLELQIQTGLSAHLFGAVVEWRLITPFCHPPGTFHKCVELEVIIRSVAFGGPQDTAFSATVSTSEQHSFQGVRWQELLDGLACLRAKRGELAFQARVAVNGESFWSVLRMNPERRRTRKGGWCYIHAVPRSR